MRSRIISGKIWHSRSIPKSHSFTYPALSFALDLDELDALDHFYPAFGINRYAIYSIFESDYLGGGIQALKERFLKRSATELNLRDDLKIVLVTMPKLFGYVFNPVNFYLVVGTNSQIESLVCEVHNTFGEAHLYFPRLISRNEDGRAIFTFPKEFYVSPFLEVAGEYKISISPFVNSLDMLISLTQKGQECFAVRFWGNGSEFSSRHLLLSALTRPLVSTLAMLRIHYQAFILYFFRSAEIAVKPEHLHLNTFCANPNQLHRLRLWVLSLPTRFARRQEK